MLKCLIYYLSLPSHQLSNLALSLWSNSGFRPHPPSHTLPSFLFILTTAGMTPIQLELYLSSFLALYSIWHSMPYFSLPESYKVHLISLPYSCAHCHPPKSMYSITLHHFAIRSPFQMRWTGAEHEAVHLSSLYTLSSHLLFYPYYFPQKKISLLNISRTMVTVSPILKSELECHWIRP